MTKKWFKAGEPGAFSSPKNDAKLKRTLKRQLLYETTRPRRIHFPRRTDVSLFFGQRWEMDVLDLGGEKSWNIPTHIKRAKSFALAAVDTFSKRVFAYAMHNKTPLEVVRALKRMFAQLKPPYPPYPRQIDSDVGGEFRGKAVEDFLDEMRITHRFVSGPKKNEGIERKIRELKFITVLDMEHNQNDTFEKIIPKAADIINNRENRTIGCTPIEAETKWRGVQDKLIEGERYTPYSKFISLYKTLQSGQRINDGSKTFGLYDWVLVVHDKTPFEKETVRNYTYKPWQIMHISVERSPYLYWLRDSHGNAAKRRYYAKELRRMAVNPLKGTIPVAGVTRKAKVRGKERWKARFVDHEAEYDRWLARRKHGLQPPKDLNKIPYSAAPIKSSRDRRAGRPTLEPPPSKL